MFLTSYNLLPQLINGKNMSKPMMRWIVELQEFQFSFLIEESTRATLAYLLTYRQSPLLIKENALKKPDENVPDLQDAYILYFDGSYRKNHNASSGGLVLLDPAGRMILKKGVKLDAHSNNEAEYLTLEGGLQMCISFGVKRLQIKGDALLVVKQVLGVWKSKNTALKKMCFRIRGLLREFEEWNLKHIGRDQNEEAHEAAQTMVCEVFVLRTQEPLYCGREKL